MTEQVLIQTSGAITMSAPGLYSGIPMGAYLADPCPVPSLNATTAITMIQESPLHGWTFHPRHPKPQPREDSQEANIGTVAHAMLLERSEDCAVMLDPNDYIGKRGGVPKGYTNDAIREARDAVYAEGKTPLLPHQMEACRSMRDAALAYLEALKKNRRGRVIAQAFEHGESETVAVAQEGPIWLRCRPDWISNDRGVAVHLKTTARSAKPTTFIRGLLPSMGYDLALSFYQRVIAGAIGQAPETYCILAQEQSPPYACSLIGLNPQYAEIMEQKIELAIATWARCMKTGEWPGYPTEICYAEPKPWQIAEAEEEMIEGFLGKPDPAQMEHGIQA